MPHFVGFQGCCGATIMYGLSSIELNDKNMAETLAHGERYKSTQAVIMFIDNSVMGQKYHADYPLKMILADNKTKSNNGKNVAQFLREKGYRVDELYIGGNPNHNELDPHKLTLYVWFLNKEEGKKPSRVREYVYGEDTTEVREPGQAPGSGTREPIGSGLLGGAFAEFRRRIGGA